MKEGKWVSKFEISKLWYSECVDKLISGLEEKLHNIIEDLPDPDK